MRPTPPGGPSRPTFRRRIPASASQLTSSARFLRRLRLANATIGELRNENAGLRETVDRLEAELAAVAAGGAAPPASSSAAALTTAEDVVEHELQVAHDDGGDTEGLEFVPGEHETVPAGGIDDGSAGVTGGEAEEGEDGGGGEQQQQQQQAGEMAVDPALDG